MKRLKSKKSKEEVKVENKSDGSEETDVPKGAWYATGKEGEQRAKAKQEELDREYNAPRRVWIKPGNEILVTFLDDAGFYFTEHNLYKNGRFGWCYTCLADYDNCPMCDAGFKPAPVCAFTVIDHSKFKSKKGKVYQNQKRLLVVKSRALEKLKDRRKEAGGLKYKVVRLKRFSDKESVTGEDFMVKRAEPWPIKKLLSFVPADIKNKDEIKKWLKPYDYMEIFKPFSAEKLRRLLPGGGGPPPIGSSEDVGNFGTVDDDLEQYLK